MKNFALALSLITALASFTACKKCETCSGTAVTTYLGTPTDTLALPAQEYCDERLDVVKAGTVTTNGDFTITETYTCDK